VGEVFPSGYSFHCARDLQGWVRAGAKRQFHTGSDGIALFPKGHLDDPVVVDPEGFADSILRNLQPAVDVAPEFRDEVEAQVERQGAVVLDREKSVSGLALRERADHYLPHEGLEPAAGRREHAPSVHRRIVVVDARGNREYEAQEVVGLFLL